MKQQKLTGYQPNYPKRVLRGAAMTAAAMVALGGMTGCVRVKIPGSGLRTDGLMSMPDPTEQELVLDGEVAIPELTEEPALQGKIVVSEPPEDTPEPTAMPLMTTGLPTLAPTPGD